MPVAPAPLWDEYGTPVHPHPPCPRCEDADEVGSTGDAAWCCACGWSGSLTELHRRAPDAR